MFIWRCFCGIKGDSSLPEAKKVSRRVHDLPAGLCLHTRYSTSEGYQKERTDCTPQMLSLLALR